MPTTTWHLPGGWNITGVLTPSDEFTPTISEWLLSMVDPDFYSTFTDKSGESLLYHSVNFSMLSAQALWGSELAAFRGLQMLRYQPAILVSSALRTEFERHGALGPGSPAHRHNREATSWSMRFTNQIISDIRSFLN